MSSRALAQGGDAERHFERALTELGRASEKDSSGAELYLWRARWRVLRGLPAAADVENGLAAAETAAALRRDLAEVEETRARLHQLRAWTTSDPRARDEALAAARAVLVRVLEFNPLLERQTRDLATELE